MLMARAPLRTDTAHRTSSAGKMASNNELSGTEGTVLRMGPANECPCATGLSLRLARTKEQSQPRRGKPKEQQGAAEEGVEIRVSKWEKGPACKERLFT